MLNETQAATAYENACKHGLIYWDDLNPLLAWNDLCEDVKVHWRNHLKPMLNETGLVVY